MSLIAEQKLKTVRTFRFDFLFSSSSFRKHFTRVMLALRDYTVRPFRDGGPQTNLDEPEFEQALAETEEGVRALHQSITASVSRIDDGKREIRFKIFERPLIEKQTKSRLLTAMEFAAFDYNQFNF